jgi:CheY-like chemotaxis protein
VQVLLVEPNAKDCGVISAQLKECSYQGAALLRVLRSGLAQDLSRARTHSQTWRAVHAFTTQAEADEYLESCGSGVDLFLCEVRVEALDGPRIRRHV